MTRPAILTVLALIGVMAVLPTTPAADKPAADDKAAAPDLSKKFIAITHKSGESVASVLLKKVEYRKLGSRDFVVGEYVVNEKEGIEKEWEGVQLWLPVDGLESLMVFSDETKAWAAIKASKKE